MTQEERRRYPRSISKGFIQVQDDYLQGVLAEKHITEISELSELQNDIYLWRGDITTLKCGAIVNAANSGMTGCYQPCHNCIFGVSMELRTCTQAASIPSRLWRTTSC